MIRLILRAPANCVQYFTGSANVLSTFNHQGGIQLSGQNYAFCMRQEQGTTVYQTGNLMFDYFERLCILFRFLVIIHAHCKTYDKMFQVLPVFRLLQLRPE